MAQIPSALHALVTGGSRGIGRAIAQLLASRGVRVAIHYHSNREAAQHTLSQLPGEGHDAFRADLSQPGASAELWRNASGALGAIDILVNNAGIYEEHPVLSTDPVAWQAAWSKTITTNLLAPAELSHAAGRAMAHQPDRQPFGRGRIVNVSSRGAFRGEPDAAAYGASKAGLNSLSQSFAKALAPQQIYVFCLAPTWVETDLTSEFLSGPRGDEIRAQHPIGRVMTSEEIAQAAIFCALDAPAAMTGAILDLNGASYLRT